MKKYCAGSHLAFGKLYQRHKAASYRYFLRQCRNHHQAEDLIQKSNHSESGFFLENHSKMLDILEKNMMMNLTKLLKHQGDSELSY